MNRIISKRIGRLLVENGIITEEQLKDGLKRQEEKGEYIGQNLVELGYTTEDDIVGCLTTQYGYPYLPLKNYEINPEIIKSLPKEMARDYFVIPIDKIGNVLTVAMANPLQEAIEVIEKATGCKVAIFVSTGSEIQSVLEKYYGITLDNVNTSRILGEIDIHEEKRGM